MKCFILLSMLTVSLAAHAFDLEGHRGARGLAPENTLAAFEKAMAIGVTTLELDIGLTSDGIPVVSHDPFLAHDMARNASGEWLGNATPLIRSLSLAELQTYDLGRAREGSATTRNFPDQQPRDGERVPTLAALFERVKTLGAEQVRFNIETKLSPAKPDETATPEEMVKALLAVIQQAGMAGRVTIQSFDWRTLKLVQQEAPSIPTAYLTMKTRNANNAADPTWTGGLRLGDYPSVAHMVKAAGGSVWSPNFAALDEATVKSAQAIGLKVIPWTVNQPADMQRLIGWGVDGIISDYPDRLRAAMQAAGIALPIPVQRRSD
ncbi:MAG: glycerophosphodiester phosphodiesterase [Ottowia sp.]|uniref:glycerophosphodiester phosphodiesterase n=1 Tax=Ottowia sp. TaxID=1898956 RepID=UPI003C77170E